MRGEQKPTPNRKQWMGKRTTQRHRRRAKEKERAGCSENGDLWPSSPLIVAQRTRYDRGNHREKKRGGCLSCVRLVDPIRIQAVQQSPVPHKNAKKSNLKLKESEK